MFGYDVGVAVRSDGGFRNSSPGTDESQNEHYRIWGKPIYAIADGDVVHALDTFPQTRPRLPTWPAIQQLCAMLDPG